MMVSYSSKEPDWKVNQVPIFIGVVLVLCGLICFGSGQAHFSKRHGGEVVMLCFINKCQR